MYLLLFLSNYYPGTAVLCFRLLSAFSGVFFISYNESKFFVYHEEISKILYLNVFINVLTENTIYKPPQISLIHDSV